MSCRSSRWSTSRLYAQTSEKDEAHHHQLVRKLNKKTIRKGKVDLTNLDTKVEGDQLIITVDLKQRHGTSKSGKNAIIATTQGNVTLPGREEVVMGINIYTKAESK
jgi:hypothetical protein